ncbi:MAG: TRAP transporter substrate-binding protein [Rhodospirillales bacterium]|nr:TRAP transporter substrate-binding protein [Rhodospirillales bacterium]
MLKRMLGLLGTASLVAAMATPASAVELKLGHYAQEAHPAHKAAMMMAEGVAKRTNNAVTIKIYPANQLGDGNEVLEQQMKGAVDLSLPTQPMLDKYGDKGNKPFGVVMLPFVYTGYEHAWKVLDGPFAKWVAPSFDKLGLVHLANWEWGFRNLTNNKRPIMTPDDVKGLKIRTPGEIQLQSAMEAAGGIVTKIAFPELPMALKQGVVDGQENPLSVIYHNKLYEVQSHLALTYHSYNSMMAIASKQTWGKLSADQQNILKEEAQKAGQWFRNEVLKEEKDLVAKLKEKGMKVTEPNLAAFKAKMQPAYDAIAEYSGKANVEAFLKMVAETK